MKRTPLEIIELKGNPVEVAFALGEKRAKTIALRVDYWNAFLAQLYRGKRSLLKSMEKEFLRYAMSASTSYVEEIHAIAEGAGLPFADLFRLNLTELKAFGEKCSTLILPFATPNGRRIMIAHNEDWTPEQNDVFILKVKMPDVSYAILTYDGYLPGLSSGVNSHGLCHAVNYVLAKDIRPATPRGFITRFLVTAKNSKECLDWIRKTKRAFGQSIHLAEKDKYMGIEITAKKIVLRHPALPTLHTNHYLSPVLKTARAIPSENSLLRQKIGTQLLKNKMSKHNPDSLTKKQVTTMARDILSDRSGFPYCLWRDADNPKETSATVATALFSTDSGDLDVYRNKPDSCEPLKAQL